MVVLHHYSQYALSELGETNLIFKALSAFGGYLGVALFFFFSGYGLMESEQKHHLNLKAFIQKRFVKIYLPVVLVTILWVAVLSLGNSFKLSVFENLHNATGGGNQLIVSTILFGFYDGVLWFIKVLVFLYASFFIFSIIVQTNEIAAWALLIGLTITVMWASCNLLGSYSTPGIPLFTIGVFASRFKNTNWKRINISIIPVLAYGIIQYFQGGNYFLVVIMMLMIMLGLMIIQPHLECPSLLAALSFDIYLVHNKVLMIGRNTDGAFPLLSFLLITLAATLVFHFIHNYTTSFVNHIIPQYRAKYETRL